MIPDMTPARGVGRASSCAVAGGLQRPFGRAHHRQFGRRHALCNPWLLTWDELRPSQVLRIDLDGQRRRRRLAGPIGYPAPPRTPQGPIRRRLGVADHPLFGTVWADLGEVPPILDQSSALGGGTLTLVDEYEGPVNDSNSQRRAVTEMGDASMALLAGHGVFILGGSAHAVHQRAVALEQRCQHAWYTRAAGGNGVSKVPDTFINMVARSDGEGFIGFWEAAVRAELAAEPELLDS